MVGYPSIGKAGLADWPKPQAAFSEHPCREWYAAGVLVLARASMKHMSCGGMVGDIGSDVRFVPNESEYDVVKRRAGLKFGKLAFLDRQDMPPSIGIGWEKNSIVNFLGGQFHRHLIEFRAHQFDFVCEAKQHSHFTSYVNGHCRPSPSISDYRSDPNLDATTIHVKVPSYLGLDGHPRSLIINVSLPADPVRVPTLDDVKDHENSGDARQNGGSPRRWDLFFGGVSSPFLGIQILCIVFVGLIFACGVAFGVHGVLDDDNGNRRWLWGALAALCFPLCLSFYGWAWMGHPLAVWGVR